MKKHTLFLLVIMLFSWCMPTHCLFEIFQRKARHPLNEPSETSNIFTLLRTGPHIQTASQVGFLVLMAACYRMHNKTYNRAHLALKESIAPTNIFTNPFKCIDDGLIGHPGDGSQTPYGILGTSWSLVPKIDKTLIAVDQTKRKAEAWTHWLQKNLRELSNQTVLERWWEQLKQAIQIM